MDYTLMSLTPAELAVLKWLAEAPDEAGRLTGKAVAETGIENAGEIAWGLAEKGVVGFHLTAKPDPEPRLMARAMMVPADWPEHHHDGGLLA